jgi:hypothetical protein
MKMKQTYIIMHIFLNNISEMKVNTEIMNTLTAIHSFNWDNDWTAMKLLEVNPNVWSLHN